MSRSLTPLIHMLAVVLLATACSSRRNASERDCARAEKHRAKAIWLCPKMLGMDSAEVRFVLPGDSAATTARYTDPVLDSLLAACEQFAAALAMERDLYHYALSQRADTTTPLPPPPPPYTGPATDRVRQHACAFEPITARTGLCVATVRPGPNGPLLTLEQLPVDTVATAPCPPQVKPAPCPECTGVSPFYKWGFWILLILLALIVLILFLAGHITAISARANQYHG